MKIKINFMSFVIPLFYLMNQYTILGIDVGLLLLWITVIFQIFRYKIIYIYKPLLYFFFFMLLHDILKSCFVSVNIGIWIERIGYFFFLSCIKNRVTKTALFESWRILSYFAICGLFFQAYEVYILGEMVSTIKIFSFLESNSENYLRLYNRPHSFFLEPASYCSWILPFLWLCLERRKYFLGIIISLSILLSTSSLGIVMCFIMWILFLLLNIKHDKKISSEIVIGIVLMMIIFIKVNIFSYALNKLQNISFSNVSNATRTTLGFRLFWDADLKDKVLGIPYMNIQNYLKSGRILLTKYGLNSNLKYLGFVNSLARCLLEYGIIGTIFYLNLFFEFWKKLHAKDRIYLVLCVVSILSQSSFWNSLFVIQISVVLCAIKLNKSFIKLKLL